MVGLVWQCMCSDCAKVLRYQTNRCPICRTPVERLLEIKVPKNDFVDPSSGVESSAFCLTSGSGTSNSKESWNMKHLCVVWWLLAYVQMLGNVEGWYTIMTLWRLIDEFSIWVWKSSVWPQLWSMQEGSSVSWKCLLFRLLIEQRTQGVSSFLSCQM
jgi:hypothetical protein